MRMMRWFCAALLLASALAARADGKRKRTMTPFEQAKAHFRHDVAAAYHRGEGTLKVAPDGEDYTGFAEHRTGALYAFEATWPIEPPPAEGRREVTVRGYADEKGEVVLEKKGNLGVLLREARMLDAA